MFLKQITPFFLRQKNKGASFQIFTPKEKIPKKMTSNKDRIHQFDKNAQTNERIE